MPEPSKSSELNPADAGDRSGVEIEEHPRPDLTLRVRQTTAEGGPALTFELHLHTRPATDREQFGTTALGCEPREYFQRLFREVDDLAHDQTLGQRLAARGEAVARGVLPPALLERLWQLQATVKTVQIISDESSIPWELVRLSHQADGGWTPGLFLCEAFAITRWRPGCKSCYHLPLRKLAVVVTDDHDLDAVEDERREILELAGSGRQVEEIPADYEKVIAAMAAARFDGWHFIGHGHAASNDPYRCGIPLGADGDELTPDELAGAAANLRRKRPLIFLNNCRTAEGKLALDRAGGWGPTMIEAGAGAFVGASWAIHDQPARAFVRLFYRNLLTGQPIGEAVRLARLAVRDDFKDDPTWLAYSVYAHPLAAVKDPGPRPRLRPPRSWKWPAILSIALVLSIATILLWRWWPQPRPAVAVFDLENGHPTAPWLSIAIPEVVNEHLAAGDQLRTIDRTLIAVGRAAIAEIKLSDKEEPAFWRRNLGVDYLVRGLLHGGKDLRLRILDTETGEAVGLEPIPLETPQSFLETAALGAERIREQLDVPALADDQKRSARASFPADYDLAQSYAKGLGEYRSFRTVDARETFQDALAQGGHHPIVHLALSRVLAELAYVEEARQALAVAVANDDDLSWRQRMVIEATFADKWTDAERIYARLHEQFPDELDYCIESAHAWIAPPDAGAEAASKALEKLESCRGSGATVPEAILIDLEAAEAQFILGRPEDSLRLTEQAAARGEREGWFFFVAVAQLREARTLGYLGEAASAREKLGTAEHAFNRAGSWTGLFSTCITTAIEVGELGEHEIALDVLERCAALSRSRKYDLGNAMVRQNRGWVLIALNRLDEALTELTAARDVADRLGHRSLLADAVLNLGVAYYFQDQPQKAWKSYREAAGIMADLQQCRKYAPALSNMGEILFATGFLGEAERLYDRAAGIKRRIGARDVDYEELRLAEVFAEQKGRYDDAKAIYEKALLAGTDFPVLTGTDFLALARMELESGNEPGAREAAALAARMGDPEESAIGRILEYRAAIDESGVSDSSVEALYQAVSMQQLRLDSDRVALEHALLEIHRQLARRDPIDDEDLKRLGDAADELLEKDQVLVVERARRQLSDLLGRYQPPAAVATGIRELVGNLEKPIHRAKHRWRPRAESVDGFPSCGKVGRSTEDPTSTDRSRGHENHVGG